MSYYVMLYHIFHGWDRGRKSEKTIRSMISNKYCRAGCAHPNEVLRINTKGVRISYM